MASPHIGDDAAVIGQTVYSADAFCEGIHFQRSWMRPEQIGRKAMLVNLSDAVAMNAEPKYALVTVALPQDFTSAQIDMLMGAIEETAAEWGCEIIGGDTVGGEKLHLSITLISESQAPLLRTGLREGDLLAYTGELGHSRRDWLRLEAGKKVAGDSPFFVPVLRRDFVRAARPLLRGGMDISDGLFCDTNNLLEANRIGMNVLQDIPPEIGESGEEYEMLVAFDPGDKAAIVSLALSMNVPLTLFAQISHNDERFPCKSHHFG